MSTVLSVETRLTGDASQMIAATKAAQNTLKNLEASVKNIRDTFDGAGNKIGNAVADGAMKAIGALQSMAAQAASVLVTIGGIAVAMGLGFFQSAARVQELDIAMQAVAKSTGIAYDEIRAAADAVHKNGIEMAAAQELATQFARMQLNLADAAKISRVSQDLAVVSGQNSTQVTLQLLGAISTQNSEMLRTAGITKSAAEGYDIYAAAIGTTADKLTDAQKKQAIINLIMDEGAKVAGTYEAAMTSASKVIRSMPRILNDISVSLGGGLLDAFGPAVVAGYDLAKSFSKAIDVGGNLRPIVDAIGDAITRFAKPISETIIKITEWVKGLNASPEVIRKVTDTLSGLGSMAPGIAAVAAAIASIGIKGIPILGDILPAINPVLAGFLALTAASPELRTAMIPLFDAIKGALPQVRDLIENTGRSLMTKFIPAFEELIRALVPVIPALITLATVLARNIMTVLPGVITMFTGLVNAVVPLLTWVSKLPVPIQGVAAALIGLQVAGVPVGGMLAQVGEAMVMVTGHILGAKTGVMSLGDALSGITTKGGGVTGALSGIATFITGPWGLAIAGAVAAVGIFALSAMPQAVANADELTASLDRQTGAFTEATKASVIKALTDDGTFAKARELGLNLDQVTAAAMGQADGIAYLDGKYADLKTAMEQSYDAGGSVDAGLLHLNDTFNEVHKTVVGQTGALADAREEWGMWAEATGAVKVAHDTLTAAVEAATGAVAANGTGLDENTAAGIANKAALDAVAQAGQALITTAQNSSASTRDLTLAQEAAYDAFLKSAEGAGVAKDEAIKLAAAYFAVPESKIITVSAYTEEAMAKLDSLKGRLAELRNAGFSVGAPGAMTPQANGGMWDGGGLHYANGALHQARQSMIAMGGRNITWAEPETGWEAYISGKKSMAQRSASIWADAGKRLGLLSDQAPGAQGGALTLENHFHGSYMDPDSVAQATLQTMRFATTP